jgi:lipid-binding SYLF domain-containing protein
MIRSHLVLACIVLLALAGCRSAGEFGSEPEQLVERSRVTFQSMMKDDQLPGMVDLASRAKAIIIIPNTVRAAFFFGGRGGNAVMLVRDENGKWSDPAFYTIGGFSWGLQIGGQSSEVIITVMSEKGLSSIMNREVTIGADAGLAVGELGKGVNAATGMGLSSDLYAFARSEGLFVGVSIEGAVISPRETWNQQLYGDQISPEAILIDRTDHTESKAVADLVAAMP